MFHVDGQMDIRTDGWSEGMPYRQTDNHDEANSRFCPILRTRLKGFKPLFLFRKQDQSR